MKLNHNSAPVEVSGGSQNSSFSIAMNGKAFRVLSDTLYQNKIGSIVREVSCNAKDAHVAAGKADIPFEIHLPDNFEPWFSVKDFGVGLSPQDMVNVFTVYFQSTKDDSNDAVGAFGLGAKTPFSYTDQFTVTSVKDGVRYIYSAFITESGVPSIREMAQSPTDEQNGVEIKMSVKSEDFNKFSSEVASQLRFFKVKPVINNRRNFMFNSVSDNLVIDSENVAVSSDSAGYGQAWAHIIQGDVGYPLDVQQIREKISADNVRLLNTLQGSQVRFYFNIGEIGVTASREGVEYNPHTIKSIDAKLTKVRAELTKFITDQIKNLPSAWEKAMFLNSSNAINRLARGADIDIPNVNKNSSGYYYFSFEDLLLNKNEKDSWGRPAALGVVKAWYPGKAVRETCDASIQPTPAKKVVISFRDTANKPNIRAKHYLATHPDVSKLIEIDMFKDGSFDAKFVKALKEKLGGYGEIIRLSEIEPPAREVVDKDGKRVRATYTRPTYYSHVEYSGSNVRDWNREFDSLADNDEDMVYVEIADMALVKGSDVDMVSKYATLCSIQDNTLPLIGIRSGDLKKIEGMDNYIALSDYVEKCIKRIKADKSLYISWRHYLIGCEINNVVNHSFRTEEVLNALNEAAAGSAPTKFFTLAAKLTASPEVSVKVAKIQGVARLLGWDESKVLTPKVRSRIVDCYEAIKTRYPLLRLYGDWQTRNVITPEHLAKYVSVM